MTGQHPADADFRAEWAAWHRQHEAMVADPHGYLAVTGLHWLHATAERFAGAPGAWSTGPGGIEVALADDEEIIVDGQVIHGRHRFGVLKERDAIHARAGGAVIEITRHGGNDILRPRHPDNPLRASFRGCPTFRPDQYWVVRGRYVSFDRPRPVIVGSVAEGLQHVYESPGRVEFRLAAAALAVTTFNGSTPGCLDIIFTDRTSGVTTYPANRLLQVGAPGPGGMVTLDFNRAVNLACAYTNFVTCPLPPPENRLPVWIEAGEKIPYERAAESSAGRGDQIPQQAV